MIERDRLVLKGKELAKYASNAVELSLRKAADKLMRRGSVIKDALDGSGKATAADGYSWAQKKLLAGLVVANILNGSLIAVMIPFFPVEAASRGASQTVISVVFSCYAAGHVLLSPVIGRLAPVLGVTRLYSIGIATAGVSTLVFGTLHYITDTQTFVAACLVTRLVEAAGMTAVSICAYTIAGSQFPGRINTVVALLGSSLNVGLAMTPVIWGSLYSLGGFGAPFFTLGAVMLLMAVVNLNIMPAVQKQGTMERPDFFPTLWVFLRSTDNWASLAAVFMSTFDLTTIEACLSPYANSALGITPEGIGLYLFISYSFYIIFSFFWGWLAERVRNSFLLMSPCLFMVSAGLLVLSPSPLLGLRPSAWLLATGMSLQQIFSGGAFIPCYKTMLDASVAGGLESGLTTQAFVSSMLQTTDMLAMAVGPITGGWIVDHFGFPVMTTVLAGITALLSLLLGIKAASRFIHRQSQTSDKV